MGVHEIPAALFTFAVVIFLFRRGSVDALIELINNFRGGPPTPMHPSPADDGAVLRRRSWKTKS